MSKYTTQVRFICETYAELTESVGYSDIDSVIEKSRDKVFDFDFPIYDESYRSVLETKILKRYYTREIGLETVALWKHFLCTRLNEIMPYYNQLYESATLEFNPFYDVDLTTDSNRGINHDESTTAKNTLTNNLTDKNTGGNTDSSVNKYSDTPQGALTNVENDTYLTNARIINNSNSHNDTDTHTGTQNNDGEGTRKFNSTDEYLEHVKGKRGGASYSKLLQEYRNTFVNIDVMIINELGDLFLNLW